MRTNDLGTRTYELIGGSHLGTLRDLHCIVVSVDHVVSPHMTKPRCSNSGPGFLCNHSQRSEHNSDPHRLVREAETKDQKDRLRSWDTDNRSSHFYPRSTTNNQTVT